MKELFDNKKRVSWREVSGLVLLDTCFIIDCVSRNKKVKINNLGVTSFNVEELLRVEHRLGHLKRGIRKFIKDTDFVIVEVPVSPGAWMQEKDFVQAVDHGLLKNIADTSDAVLMAAAIQTQSDVLTKDKHHLFTTQLENFLYDYGIHVYKELKDIQ
ncbi:hypothetical protein HOD38_03390 [archaeon]|jgi:hypothetical protein|nr:hypothetical protein [archaeon]MBT4397284.1 hypothetical protein [archaeon]MBT4440664.1 hypothetical protein [archaeon]